MLQFAAVTYSLQILLAFTSSSKASRLGKLRRKVELHREIYRALRKECLSVPLVAPYRYITGWIRSMCQNRNNSLSMPLEPISKERPALKKGDRHRFTFAFKCAANFFGPDCSRLSFFLYPSWEELVVSLCT